MIGAGTIISPIIKIVTTVAILAAAYVFIIKPTLDTTEKVTDSVSNSFGESFGEAGGLSPSIEKSIRQAEKLQEQAAQASQTQVQDANKLLGCITRAEQDVEKITACNEKFSP